VEAKDVSLAAVFAGLYAAINIVQTSMGGLITYGPIQLRLADCLIPLSAVFGWPQIFGVSIGCLSNAYYWLDPADVVVGPVVNFVAAAVILMLRRRRIVALTSGAVTVGVSIGLYLYCLYAQGNPVITGQVPSFPGVPMPIWSAFVASLTISSVITIAVVGYILLNALSRPAIIELLKSRGLKVYTQ
jgi:uncharacterized membrane protein